MPTHLLRWVGLALGTFALGTIGFHTAMPERSMFSAIQIFALNSGDVDGTVPWRIIPTLLARISPLD